MPLIASAQMISASSQAVNTSASVQQSFLSELQVLQQELVALTATLQAMIAASGGLVASTTPATVPTIPSLVSGQQALPFTNTIFPTSNLTGDDLTNALLQAIAPSTNTPAVQSVTTAAASSDSSASNTTTSAAAVQSIANQLDPSCVAGVWSNNSQCGSLFYCTSNGGYWSAASCPTN